MEMTTIKPTNSVGLINLPARTLFSQVDFSLQQQIITSSVSTNYAYKSTLDTLLYSDVRSQENALQNEVFFKDTPSAIDDSDGVSGGNVGLFYRYTLTRVGGVVELLGELSLELMNEEQQRPLINGVQLGLKLWPNKKEFCLMSSEDNVNYKIDIVDAKLKLKHVKLSPGAFIGHQEAIASSEALYPFYRSDIKTFNIPSGQYSFSADDLYLGSIPSMGVIKRIPLILLILVVAMSPF